MRVEVPLTIRVYFRLAPNIIYDAAIGNQIGRELLGFFDVLFGQLLEGQSMYGKIRPENYNQYALDLSKLKIKLTLGGESEYTTGIMHPLFSNIDVSFKIVYQDDKPYTKNEEQRILRLIHGNLPRGTRILTHFTEESNPIFKGDYPYFDLWHTSDRNLNVQARTRRRAIQGISALPQNVANIVANYAVGPRQKRNYGFLGTVPPELSNETLLQPFEIRLAKAEEARAAAAPPEVVAQIQQQAEPKTNRPWYKRIFSKKRRGGKRRNQHKRNTRRTR